MRAILASEDDALQAALSAVTDTRWTIQTRNRDGSTSAYGITYASAVTADQARDAAERHAAGYHVVTGVTQGNDHPC